MSTLAQCTEVQETELDSSDPMIRFEISTRAEDETEGTLQLELLSRVEDILKKITNILSQDFDRLPSQVQELGALARPGDFLQRLNLIVKDGGMDDFLRNHPRCRRLFSQLFGCRYSYLEDQDSGNSDIGNEGTGQTTPSETAVASEREALLTASPNLASKEALSECIDAFNAFDPLYSDLIGSIIAAWPFSQQELEVAERMYQHMDTILSMEGRKLNQGASNMTLQPKVPFAECLANIADISKEYQENFQKKIFGQLPAKSGIELELTFGSPNPEENADGDGDIGDSVSLEGEIMEDTIQRPGIPPTSSDLQLQPYKGWYIEGPRIKLVQAKNFLADGDIDHTVDWPHRFAELTEYFAYLHPNWKVEDWIHDLKEAVDMQQVHWIFENYLYGTPELLVDPPTDFWPKQSTRLPPIPGSNIAFRAVQRGLSGPRRLLHVDVASVHDGQYEMPADVLRRDYLEPYRNDSEKFWAAGPFADTTEPANLAVCENKTYEDCTKGGIVKTAQVLSSKDDFLPPHQSHGSALQVERKALEAFAQFRGGKRAALQQCLNIFTHGENRKMCTSSRVLILPDPPVEKKPDMGIIYAHKMLKNPPEKESRDPWAYTRVFQWFKKEELRWAQWTKEHAIKESYGHKRYLHSDKPIMELPRNWKGPVAPDLMDREMSRTYKFLRRCQKILQGLKRAKNRDPRDFIKGLLEAVNAGLAAKSVTREMNMRFSEHEYESTDGVTFAIANLRPTEAAWLEYICQPSRNRPLELQEALGKRGEIMVSRVTQMMQDINPLSLFRDSGPKKMEKFLKGLNITCGGEVKRYEFTEKDVKQLAPKLRDLRILKLYKKEVTGEWMFGRPETEFHPEDLVRWLDSEPQTPDTSEEEPLACSTSQTSPQSENMDQIQDDTRATPTEGTGYTPTDDFDAHPWGMPRREDVLSLHEFIENPVRNPEWYEKTTNFFLCLGYRLGKTLRQLQAQHEENEEKLSDPETQEYNRNFLNTIISYWEEDTKKRPNDVATNCAKEGSWRITMTYPDVVKIADPDACKEHREAWTRDRWPESKEAYELVRRNLLSEAHENKTMLWPLHLPYNSYATRYKVVDPTIWRERLSKKTAEILDDNNLDIETKESRVRALKAQLQKEEAEEEKKQDALAAQKQNLKTMRREPVWTFGHPSRKKLVHMFWDVNNWPVHWQSESRQRVIRSRGPARRKASEDEAAAGIGEGLAAFAEELEEAAEIPFWKRAEQRRKFVPGREEFWMGDTPLQRKEFEERMKKRLAPRPRKRTWGDVFKEALLGSSTAANEPAAASDEGFGLPSVPRHLIPRSRPAKRRRIVGPQREDRGRDIFAISRGEKETRAEPNIVTMESWTSSLEAGQVTFYIPETRMQGEGRLEDVMEMEPMVEYVKPVKGR
ncbi:uncharacterized protein Triagg1_10341 [Trichoderma aggressivum f. europaeum]|uniref:Uncharacterized protein n=1 Tax=Trichoderma aggressivum f. europaeum TaxID=173218 RepID=A0AAE1I5G2_9HYPO|nr:hypothetical protein Triagg1_10341 [Trichoderma aggressivum f. europaeum]